CGAADLVAGVVAEQRAREVPLGDPLGLEGDAAEPAAEPGAVGAPDRHADQRDRPAAEHRADLDAALAGGGGEQRQADRGGNQDDPGHDRADPHADSHRPAPVWRRPRMRRPHLPMNTTYAPPGDYERRSENPSDEARVST